MILYLDASVLVKRYIAELGAAEVAETVQQAEVVGTSLISKVEVTAALAKAVRLGVLPQDEAAVALRNLRDDWPDLVRVQVSELLVAQAEFMAWEYGLRGYDAMHLAAARMWQDGLGECVVLATFDQQLWRAARRAGLLPYPDDLPALLNRWQSEQR